MRRRAQTVLFVMAASIVPGCSVVEGGGDSYRLVAEFERAVGLYEGGRVLLMGIDIGTVEEVDIDDTGVRIEMSIDAEVPLPVDVRATIEALTLIGERSVVLFPAWDESRDGQPRAPDGHVIPSERSIVPVEPDEGLEAFHDLARSFDPAVLDRFVRSSAEVLDGRGETLGEAIDTAAALSSTFAELDEQLTSTAKSVHQLTGSLGQRTAQLQTLIDTFADASTVLASEREGIQTFLASLVTLTGEGQRLLDLYREQLPADAAHLAALAHVFARNADSIEQLLAGFPTITAGLANGYDEDIDGLALNTTATPTLVQFLANLRAVLADIAGAAGGSADR